MTKDEMAQNNLEIARLLHPDQHDDWYKAFLNGRDYYNNWSDLMPVIQSLREELDNFPIDIVFDQHKLAEIALFFLREKAKDK